MIMSLNVEYLVEIEFRPSKILRNKHKGVGNDSLKSFIAS